MLVLSLLAAGCGGSREILDAGDALDACDATKPAVRLHLTFGFVSESSTPWWGSGRDALRLYSAGGAGPFYEQSYDFDSTSLDAAHQATVILRYPAGATAATATVAFYAIVGAGGIWQSSTDFAADPGACTDVDLFVPFTSLGDAGVPNDAGAP